MGIASTGTGGTAINNSGTITGTGVAIRSETSATTLNNLAGGSINGAIFLSGLNDAVNNAGAIAGSLNLGAGDDLYDGRNGSVSGTIDAGSGDDVLIGGTGADRLAGDGGDDLITGGGGGDTLTGGAGRDTFRDEGSRLNGATITDFGAGDRIVISDANVDLFSFSLIGSTLNYTGGSLTLSGVSGRLVASASAGGGVELRLVENVRDDFNGDGRSDVLWRHETGSLTNWLGQEAGGFIANGLRPGS